MIPKECSQCENNSLVSTKNGTFCEGCGFRIEDATPKRATKFKEGKPDLSLLPLDILSGLARTYEAGMLKGYDRSDWRNGFPPSELVAAALRHLSKFWDEGVHWDEEILEKFDFKSHHIDMAIFNLVALKNTLLNHPNLVPANRQLLFMEDSDGDKVDSDE